MHINYQVVMQLMSRHSFALIVDILYGSSAIQVFFKFAWPR